jgi:hypothetical protein
MSQFRGSNDLLTQQQRLRACRLPLLGICIAVCLHARATCGEESTAAVPSGRQIETYRSGRIELNTDMPAEDAAALLKRLESTLRTISRYWRRPLGRRVMCFVADDLANWPDDALPHPQAKLVIEHVGGCTQLQSVPDSKSADAELVANIFATSTTGIAEHELVHAYCLLTFGTCGPEWYKEGMAEMAFHYGTNRKAVTCPADVVEMLRRDRAMKVAQIIDAGEFTQPITARFHELSEASLGLDPERGRWDARDSETVEKARQAYHRSWALCYFLANNPNYHERFRQLGICYLNRLDADFDEVFGPDAKELAFEFDLFLREIDDGYRVDLCRWNWKKEFAAIGEGEAINVHVLAARGYQPSGLLVTAGKRYQYVAEGQWNAGRDEPVTADGNYLGHGCLEGVIMSDFALSLPFHLGAKGSFGAPQTGKLYLRCRDDWSALADNEGSLTVRLQRSGRGQVEPAP